MRYAHENLDVSQIAIDAAKANLRRVNGKNVNRYGSEPSTTSESQVSDMTFDGSIREKAQQIIDKTKNSHREILIPNEENPAALAG